MGILVLLVVSLGLWALGARGKKRAVLHLTAQGMVKVAAGQPLTCGCRITLDGQEPALCAAHQAIVEAS